MGDFENNRYRGTAMMHFQATGICVICTKTATGKLISDQGEDLGLYCKTCGEAKSAGYERMKRNAELRGK